MDNFLMIAEDQSPFLIMSLLFGALGAFVVSRFAGNLGLIDAPSERSSHILPTPKGGGIGILWAFIGGCVVFKIKLVFCLSITLLSILSLIGDRTHLSPITRLLWQFITAFIIIFELPNSPALIPSGSLSPCYSIVILFLVAVFIVGTSNFYNFMDGINGIAAVTGIVGLGLLAAYGISHGKDYNLSMLGIGMAMACLGFLPFNVPKARIFMGDVGSILLGFVFAIIVIRFADTLTEFMVLSSFLFPFYADELVSMAERIKARQSLTTPHRRHLYQVLANEAGIAHWKISLGYGVLQLTIGVCTWQVSRLGIVALISGLILASLLFFGLNNKVKSLCLNTL